MIAKTEREIKADGFYFKNPLKRDASDVITTIAISRRRLELIRTKMRMYSVTMSSGGYTEELEKLLQLGNDVANALMPNHVDDVLKESLTPNQYQRALRANHAGKTLKFSKARR